MPLTMRGTIAVPEGNGPFPVVLIAHGRHGRCTAPLNDERGGVDPFPCPEDAVIRNDLGWTYLAEALADAGYIALVPDTNEVSTNGFGEFSPNLRFNQLIDQLLAKLLEGNDGSDAGFGVDLTGRVATDHLLLIGHSQGGNQINDFATVRLADPNALLQPRVLMFVTAALFDGYPEIPDLPAAVIVSGCDGDIGPEHAMIFADIMQTDEDRLSPVETAWLPRGNHNSFNSTLPPDPFPEEGCEGDLTMPGEGQRAWMVSFTLSFFERALAA
jgi:hypothetical protein